MAVTLKIRDAGGGWHEAIVGTDNTEVPHSEKRTIAIVRFNRAAFNTLGANGKNDIISAVGSAIASSSPTFT